MPPLEFFLLIMVFDVLGSIISLLSTYFFIRLNNKAWSIGIIATCLNGWLYWSKGIYADTGLEVLYFTAMMYGWYQWHTSSKRQDKMARLGYISTLQWGLLLSIACLVFVCIVYLLQTYTHSQVVFIDAATTTLSLLAQWLMCHKIIITWVIWFITDSLFAWMYWSKGLPVHCLLMIVYMGLAVVGYWNWRRQNNNGVKAGEPLLSGL